MEENSLLTKTGMELVIHGGDARELIRKAMKKASEKNFVEARALLDEANAEILNGHRAQTKVIQLECEGEAQGYNILFCHGMDTLMTVKSEYELAVMIIDMFAVLINEK